jgi:hypothetical protein
MATGTAVGVAKDQTDLSAASTSTTDGRPRPARGPKPTVDGLEALQKRIADSAMQISTGKLDHPAALKELLELKHLLRDAATHFGAGRDLESNVELFATIKNGRLQVFALRTVAYREARIEELSGVLVSDQASNEAKRSAAIAVAKTVASAESRSQKNIARYQSLLGASNEAVEEASKIVTASNERIKDQIRALPESAKLLIEKAVQQEAAKSGDLTQILRRREALGLVEGAGVKSYVAAEPVSKLQEATLVMPEHFKTAAEAKKFIEQHLAKVVQAITDFAEGVRVKNVAAIKNAELSAQDAKKLQISAAAIEARVIALYASHGRQAPISGGVEFKSLADYANALNAELAKVEKLSASRKKVAGRVAAMG